LEDANLLIDTPEDIAVALNHSVVKEIDHVLYTHLDPDHTLGLRVFEQLRLNWMDVFEGRECTRPIHLYAMPHVMEDLNLIRSKYGPFLDYYEETRNLVKRIEVSESLVLASIKISFIQVAASSIFVFEEKGKKLIYAPCDVKPFPDHELFYDADVLIIGDTVIGDVVKDGYVIADDNPIYNELYHMNEVLALKDKFRVKELIFTHIEEDWGKSYDDLKELEKSYKQVRFAYDGMEISL
jgi:phosphoribosyl 1,2-cyclic phosphate phosphodiesterase